MKDFLKNAATYTVGPVLAVIVLFGALKLSPPASLTPAVPNLPTVNTPVDKPAPPAKITKYWVTRNQESIAQELQDQINTVVTAGNTGVYEWTGYPEKGKLQRKRIVVEDLDTPLVVTPAPTTPADPLKPAPIIVSPGLQVTYVYEKDDTAVPAAVLSGLNRLSREKKVAIASVFEKDSRTGSGEIPKQYQLAITEGVKAGLPALVVEKDGKMLNVVKDPKTEEAVFNVVN